MYQPTRPSKWSKGWATQRNPRWQMQAPNLDLTAFWVFPPRCPHLSLRVFYFSNKYLYSIYYHTILGHDHQMQIVYHIGAHCTDQESLHASLVKNNEMLVQKRVAPASTPKYRNIICGHLKAKAAGSRLDKNKAGAVGRYSWQHRSRSGDLHQ